MSCGLVSISRGKMNSREHVLIESACTQVILAHVFANTPSLMFYWTMTTIFAKISLLPVEPDVIGIVMGMRRVTKKMIDPFGWVSHILPPFPAFFVHGVVRKLVDSVILRYTIVFEIPADRSHNVGDIVMNIVVFELVVVGQAWDSFYTRLTIAVSADKVVTTCKETGVSAVWPRRLIEL